MLLYTESHEWVKTVRKEALIGISKWAQKELGEIVFVQLPEIGKELKMEELACVLESTKAAADIYTPLSGKIVEVNTELNEKPGLINSYPESQGWIFKLEMVDRAELDTLMSVDLYKELVMD